MPSTFRLVTAFAACAAALVFCPGLTRAADDDLAARRTEAEALLQAMHTEQVLTTATTRVHQMVDKYGENANAQNKLSPEQKTALQKVQEEAHATINQQLNWDAVKSDFIQAYADAFTADELKGLVAFYASPLGQKLVEKQPAVTEKMGHLTQQKMMAVVPGIVQKIQKATQKAPPVPPVPAAGPSAPTVPAVSVAPMPTIAPAPSVKPTASPAS